MDSLAQTVLTKYGAIDVLVRSILQHSNGNLSRSMIAYGF